MLSGEGAFSSRFLTTNPVESATMENVDQQKSLESVRLAQGPIFRCQFSAKEIEPLGLGGARNSVSLRISAKKDKHPSFSKKNKHPWRGSTEIRKIIKEGIVLVLDASGIHRT